MKNRPNKPMALCTALLLTVTACVDNDYDLGDIDTTTRIPVDNLTIPVNIDVVTLGDIITYDENSKIRPVTIDGHEFYALTETGNFDSDPIEISKVTAPAPEVHPTEAWLDRIATATAGAAATPSISFQITPMGNDIHYNAGEIDEAIVELDAAKTDISFSLTLRSLNITSAFERVEFADVLIQMPKGLTTTCTAGSYNPTTGLWTIPTLSTSQNHVTATLRASAVDFKTAGATIDATHKFAYDGEFRILAGTITFITHDIASIPQNLHIRADYAITDLVATSFSGTVNYKLDGIDIAPVDLGDVPDFFNCEGTDLILNNPQIYLAVNNPVAGERLTCSTGITLTAMRRDLPSVDFTPDVNNFSIGANHGIDGPYNFVLAPDNNALTTPAEFSDNLTFVRFSTLGSLLSIPAGSPADAGMPDKIGIALNDPQIPTQNVTDFALGRQLSGVRGNYELIAPLSLAAGSMIVYRHTADGWNDEDVDAITIEKLSLDVKVSNGSPLEAELFAWPIGIDGKKIEGVEIKSSHITAGVTDQPVTIEMTGRVQQLDGVIFEARVAGAGAEVLTPEQSITLTNIRAKVTGYYEKEL
ncbi:MAG: hypothetical protein J6C67_04195 [Muribaculaceae bacterium]|nr:hypothetical protein [Muribaculaceae bacterium]